MTKYLKILQAILRIMPLWCAYILGKIIGYTIYLNKRKRAVAFKNIKSSFPSMPSKQAKQMVKKSFYGLGLGIIENLIFPRIAGKLIIEGMSDLKPGGGVIVGAHIGNWELFNHAIAGKIPYAVLVKKQKDEKLDNFFTGLRKQNGLEVCFSLKQLIKFLKDGWYAGIMVDHGAEDNAPAIDFFSHKVPVPRAAVVLAKKFNKKIFIGFIRRQYGFHHFIQVKGPVSVDGKSDEEILCFINRMYQEHLTQYPYNYLWQHKRFKYKNDRDILIISDGKAGHLKQSLAMLSIFKEEKYDIRYKIIEVNYKNKITRNLSEGCALLASKDCLGCGRCLSLLVTKGSLNALREAYADIVISTGSYVAPVNKIFSSYIGAKSITILRPNIPFSRFDLCVIPEHDRVQSENTIKIKGALCYPGDVDKKTMECQKTFNLTKEKKISLFLGGPRSDKREFTANVGIFLKKLKDFSLENNYKIIASTSRRTPKNVINIVTEELGKFRQTEKIIYADIENYDFVFEGFVSLSEIVFVTSESISMISEILSMKKSCVCVMLEKYVDKYKVFLQSIENDADFVKYPYDINAIKLKHSDIFEKNKEAVKEAAVKLL